MLDIPVILGSTRVGRNSPRLARLVHRELQARDGVATSLIDLEALDLPLLHERLRFLEAPPAALVEFGEAMEASDALVIVSPEYNKGCPAVLKNAIDALGGELRRKPVGIACHSVGAFGGQVVLQTIRPIMLNLGAVPIPAAMTVPNIKEAIDTDGTPLEAVHGERATRFVEELLWYARALKEARQG